MRTKVVSAQGNKALLVTLVMAAAVSSLLFGADCREVTRDDDTIDDIMIHIAEPGQWRQYNAPDGSDRNSVMSLYTAPDDSVWVGWSGGYTTRIQDGTALGWYDERLRGMGTGGFCNDAQGNLWCLTEAANYYSYVASGWALEDGVWNWSCEMRWTGGIRVRFPAVGEIRLGPLDGLLWASSCEGIFWYDPLTGSQEEVWHTPRWDFEMYVLCAPWSLFVSSQNELWFISNSDVVNLDSTGNELRRFEKVGSGWLAESPDGTMWLGRSDDLAIFQGMIMRLEGDQFVYAGPAERYVSPGGPICFGRDGQLVTAALPGGVCVFDGAVWHYWELPFEFAAGIAISAITTTANGDIWVGTVSTRDHGGDGVWVLQRSLAPVPIFLGVAADGDEYRGGDSMSVSLDLLNSLDRTVDLYIALETPDGELLFYPGFGTSWSCFLPGLHIEAETAVENYQLFSLTVPDLPAGIYRWFAACTDAGTMEFASNIASCEWQFE